MTEQEFLTAAKERFGSRGLRQAKVFLDTPVRSNTGETSSVRDSELASFLMEIWLDSKEEVRRKFTPKKYRK